MTRMRISTTVDRDRLVMCRRKLAVNDSQLLDRALLALLDKLEAEAEQAALDAHPYENDPDLAWEAPAAPSLPYDGEVPEDVLVLARQRRRGQA